MRRMPIHRRNRFLCSPEDVLQGGYAVLVRISPGYPPCGGQVAYVLLTRAPVAGSEKQAFRPAAPRLACVKPVASVHPEPGSNSPLFILFFSFLVSKRQDK